MKVSRVQATANRERIIASAARLFREKGFDGVGVADIMADAGLTHGGFYGHFASKDDLIAQACTHAMGESEARWTRRGERESGQPLKDIVGRYVSARHRDDPGHGCALAALGSELARRDSGVRATATEGLRIQLDILERSVSGRTAAERRRKALATYAEMVGAVMLSRAVSDAALSAEILEAAAADITASAPPKAAGDLRRASR
jgi:TetR/AcrR family transcriptional repressor of nem operon